MTTLLMAARPAFDAGGIGFMALLMVLGGVVALIALGGGDGR